jgi:hypothetical protein
MIISKSHCDLISLDDCTPNWDSIKNIYVKYGFRIITDDEVKQLLIKKINNALNSMYNVEPTNFDSLTSVLKQNICKEYAFKDMIWQDFDNNYTIYKKCDGHPVEIVSFTRFLKSKFSINYLSRKCNTNGGGKKKYTATSEKINTKYGPRIVYLGARGGRYIKVQKAMQLLSRHI